MPHLPAAGRRLAVCQRSTTLGSQASPIQPGRLAGPLAGESQAELSWQWPGDERGLPTLDEVPQTDQEHLAAAGRASCSETTFATQVAHAPPPPHLSSTIMEPSSAPARSRGACRVSPLPEPRLPQERMYLPAGCSRGMARAAAQPELALLSAQACSQGQVASRAARQGARRMPGQAPTVLCREGLHPRVIPLKHVCVAARAIQREAGRLKAAHPAPRELHGAAQSRWRRSVWGAVCESAGCVCWCTGWAAVALPKAQRRLDKGTGLPSRQLVTTQPRWQHVFPTLYFAPGFMVRSCSCTISFASHVPANDT